MLKSPQLFKYFPLLLALSAQPAFAAKEDRTATFTMAGTEFTMRLPAGYCLPTGKANEVAQLMAASDNVNVTHLSAVPCALAAEPTAFNDHILLKTPKSALTAALGREELLKVMGSEFARLESSNDLLSPKSLAEVETSISNVIKQKIDLDGKIIPLGKDDACAYIGGTISYKTPKVDYKISNVACITSVSERILTFYWYGPDKGAAGIANLMLKARSLVERIEGKPAR